MEYKFENSDYSKYDIIKDGHTMFPGDVVKDLERKEYLEKQFKQLQAENKKLKEMLNNTLPYVGPFSTQSKIAKELFHKIVEITNDKGE